MFTTHTDSKKLTDEFLRLHPELGAKEGLRNAEHNSMVILCADWAMQAIDFSLNKIALDVELAIANADTVARLEEHIKNLKEKLMKDSRRLTDSGRCFLIQEIISYEKILHGDKPED